MRTNLMIPEKIKVGYNERSDTYTKKLAYVIYYDHKGVLRKETSWSRWRDHKIDPDDFENIPTEGFVLNKKAGGYSTGWNHRQTYCRVYDPRGFEFEITIPNLLYILEFNDSIKGKGLTGEYVYAWDGKDLLLLPVEAPEFKEISEFNKIMKEKLYLKSKDLKIGFNYRTKDNRICTYLGRFDYYEPYQSRFKDDSDFGKKKGKKYYFAYGEKDYRFECIPSLGNKILEEVSVRENKNYPEMFEQLECEIYYSPLDESKTEYLPFKTLEIAKKLKEDHSWGVDFYSFENGVRFNLNIRQHTYDEYETTDYGYRKFKGRVTPPNEYQVLKFAEQKNYWSSRISYDEKHPIFHGSLSDIMKKYNPHYKNEYLVNGKLYREKVVDRP